MNRSFVQMEVAIREKREKKKENLYKWDELLLQFLKFWWNLGNLLGMSTKTGIGDI